MFNVTIFCFFNNFVKSNLVKIKIVQINSEESVYQEYDETI
jgi:hypothetical protein